MQLRENAQRCNLPEDALRPACIPEPVLLQRHEVDLGGGDTSSILQSPNDEQKASDLRSGVLTDNHRNALQALLTLGPAGPPIPPARPAVRAATAACSCTTRRAPDGLGQPLPRVAAPSRWTAPGNPPSLNGMTYTFTTTSCTVPTDAKSSRRSRFWPADGPSPAPHGRRSPRAAARPVRGGRSAAQLEQLDIALEALDAGGRQRHAHERALDRRAHVAGDDDVSGAGELHGAREQLDLDARLPVDGQEGAAGGKEVPAENDLDRPEEERQEGGRLGVRPGHGELRLRGSEPR